MTSLQANTASLPLNQTTASTTEQLSAETFRTWDKEKLVDYAVRVTQSLENEQELVERLTTQFDSAQKWALAMALVEEIGRSLAATLDLNEVLTRLLSRTYNALDVADGSILLIEEHSGDLVAQVVLGSISESFRVPKGQGIAGEVAATGVPIIVNNAQEDSRHFTQVDSDTGFITHSILCVPILTHEKTLGVLEVLNKTSGPFTHQDQILLSSIANYAGIAIENAQLHEDVVEERNHVIHAQEEISHKLQRDLHDGPTQIVAAIQMSLDFCQKAIQHNQLPLAVQEINSTLELAKRASHQMRTLLFELRPLILETKGLVAALDMYLKRRQEEDDKVRLHLNCTSDQLDRQVNRLDGEVEAALFAIIQEAVNNAIKHAQAYNIFVRLEQMKDHVSISIADDGVGFDVQSVNQYYEDRGSYGMVNLRERVAIAHGEYSIDSAPGKGTEIRIDVPLRIRN